MKYFRGAGVGEYIKHLDLSREVGNLVNSSLRGERASMHRRGSEIGFKLEWRARRRDRAC